MRKKGFTLIEMLAVIALIAILSVIALGTYLGVNESAKQRTLDSKIAELKMAAEKWARENNINNQVTISVNALVVEGYVNADKVDSKGLSEITNPVTGENMICNTINISFEEGDIKTIYDDKNQNCKLASQALVDTNIKVKVIDSDNVDRSGVGSSSIAAWTNKDVIVIVDSSTYDPEEGSSLVSISYDFSGETITKKVSGKQKYTGSNFLTKDESKDYYNVFYLSAELVLNSKIVISYNTANDLSKSRAYTIRIDKEEATALVESGAEWVSENAPFTVKVDDGSGSGPRYFYTTTSPSFTNPVKYETGYKGSTAKLPVGKYYVWTEDNSGNRSQKYKLIVSVNNVDETKAGCEVLFHGTEGDHGWYISNVTPAGKNSVLAGISGMNVGVNMTEGTPSYTGFAPYNTYNEGLGEERTKETVKQGEDYWCHVKTLAGSYSNAKRRLYLDKTPPVIRVSVSRGDTYTKTKNMSVTISDRLSGLNESTTIKYGFSLSNAGGPSGWKSLEISAPVQTNESVKKDVTVGDDLTGIYYLWVDTSGFKDYAGNYPNSGPAGKNMFVYGPFKFDNTPPVCNGNNGKTAWTKGVYQIRQNCIDNDGTEDQSLCFKDLYTIDYDNKRTIKSDSVVIADKAGNETTCDYDVYLDNTKPSCDGVGGKTDWTKGAYTVVQKCKEDRETQSGCAKDEFTRDYFNTTKTSTIEISDAVGNKNTCDVNVYLDNTPPTCGAVSGDSTKWTNSNRTVTVKCVEDKNTQSGCVKDSYDKTANQSTTTDSIEISDYVGNTTSCGPYNYYVDKVAPTCNVEDYGTQCYTSGVTATVKCEDPTPDSSELDKCAGGTGSSTAVSGIQGSVTYTVTDGAGNSNFCYGTSSGQTQYRKRTCGTARRCEDAGCELYKYDCTANCGDKVDCNCDSCHTGHNTCKGGNVEKDGYKQCPKTGTSGGVICSSSSKSLSGYDVCGTGCTYTVYDPCKTGEDTCKYGCDKCWQCCRHENHGCETYYQNVEKCGCESWNAWSGYSNAAQSCAGEIKNSCETETRTIWHHGGSCGDGDGSFSG